MQLKLFIEKYRNLTLENQVTAPNNIITNTKEWHNTYYKLALSLPPSVTKSII
jgi:hypothetical protein